MPKAPLLGRVPRSCRGSWWPAALPKQAGSRLSARAPRASGTGFHLPTTCLRRIAGSNWLAVPNALPAATSEPAGGASPVDGAGGALAAAMTDVAKPDRRRDTAGASRAHRRSRHLRTNGSGPGAREREPTSWRLHARRSTEAFAPFLWRMPINKDRSPMSSKYYLFIIDRCRLFGLHRGTKQ